MIVLVRFSPHIGVCFIKEREFMEREEIDYSQYVYYDETSPTCLRWKVDRNQAVEIGSKAGGFERDKSGKVIKAEVQIKGKGHSINRVVWALFNGNIRRGEFVLYIDGDRGNNKISNLRLKVKEDYPKRGRMSEEDERLLRLYRGIKDRCGAGTREVPVAYIGAGMYSDWLSDPSKFVSFIKNTPNWNSKDQNGRWFNVEKDLFCFNSNKFGYYPDTVCFLPRDLNQAIQLEHNGQRTANRGLPVGVTKDGSRYKAQLSVNGKPKYLGSGTIDECKELYKRAKVSSIEELISVWEHMLPEKVIKQLNLFVSHLKAI